MMSTEFPLRKRAPHTPPVMTGGGRIKDRTVTSAAARREFLFAQIMHATMRFVPKKNWIAGQIRVYAATNIVLPLTNWTLLSNPKVLTNGLLRIDGLRATNRPPTFYRAVETP